MHPLKMQDWGQKSIVCYKVMFQLCFSFSFKDLNKEVLRMRWGFGMITALLIVMSALSVSMTVM